MLGAPEQRRKKFKKNIHRQRKMIKKDNTIGRKSGMLEYCTEKKVRDGIRVRHEETR